MPMTVNDIRDQLLDLSGRIRTAAQALSDAALDNNVSMQDLETRQQALNSLQKRKNALETVLNEKLQEGAAHLQPVPGADPAPAPARNVAEMLKSNEYARAFAYAVRNGITRKTGRQDEKCKPLFDALTETGSEGADGGFLVPEDIDHTIREFRRTLTPLATVFGQESTNSPTGWRVVDTAPTKGMAKMTEMGNVPTDDQPKFAKIEFKVEDYGLILPVSNDLLKDNDANLFTYLGQWFARKQVLTENALILAELKKIEAEELTAEDPMAGLKTALNKGLPTAISVAATILCNQDGFDLLDQLLDKNGRPLLQPDPTNATLYRMFGRQVFVIDNAEMPTEAEGQPVFYLGDGREFATLFTRQGFEMTSTDVGGDAFKTNSTLVRGIARMGVSVFDKAAMIARKMPASE